MPKEKSGMSKQGVSMSIIRFRFRKGCISTENRVLLMSLAFFNTTQIN
ncbi:hypothetical protein MTsPCn9_32770 [Croceitalea sp. MTPC9]|nr:hypothetical protein MTsPCn6_33070 [Croceitalea sp. MTPC6]GMN18337.1 hypothetical protein MTsPCn9_32770 [Croceitalea sp. MTPC9]